jgi:hypothetical protein
MIEAERDLAEDAEWKRIQQNTFTRWANEHLKCIDKTLMSLETDLSDGLALIALIEVLSQKKMNKHNKRPTFRSQKLENVSVALKFLEREGIKIINIDSTDIVDCKLKLILGLIWLLILHYSISMPMWDTDGGSPNDKQTPKQRLLNWVKNRIPDLPVHNFTTGLEIDDRFEAEVDGSSRHFRLEQRKSHRRFGRQRRSWSLPRLGRLGPQRCPSKRHRSHGLGRRLAWRPSTHQTR